MRLALWVGVFWAVVSVVDLGVTTQTSEGALPPPITTRQLLFSIPFQVDRAGQSLDDPVEIQLYVSADRGATWRVCDVAGPQQDHFLFAADTEDEYWFVIRTIYRSGKLRPERIDSPGLRVVVDTTLPDLRLHASPAGPGQIHLRWDITEERPDPDSLKIEYRTDPGGHWRSAAIDRQGMLASGSVRSGVAILRPAFGSQVVEIRAEVADTVGNSTVSHARMTLDPQATGSLHSVAPAGAASLPHVWQPHEGAPGAVAMRRDPIGHPVRAIAYQRDSNETAPNPFPETGVNTPAAEDAPAGPLEDPAAVRAGPTGPDPYASPTQVAGDAGQSEFPTKQRPKMIRSRQFEIDYRVGSAESSGSRRVELWGTRDGGRTWVPFGVDPDNRSPILASVAEDGVYGFRIVLQGGLGTDGQRPRSGDTPDVWIGVDVTKPYAQVVSTELGTGQSAGYLFIHWHAEDQLLAAGPVSLSFRQYTRDPWQTIASGLENTGRYAWQFNGSAPRRFHLQLEVRDEAGNVTQIDRPVSLDRLLAAPQISAVRPVVRAAPENTGRLGYKRIRELIRR